MIRLFKETPIFTKKIDALGAVHLLGQIQDAILENPDAGSTISGTGGLKKMRVADPKRGKGKRGGLRVIYLDLPAIFVTFLVYIYGKDEADDLTPDEKSALKYVVEILKGEGNEKAKNRK